MQFPTDITNAIVEACAQSSLRHYGAHFTHTDTGEPTASLGRLSGGIVALGIADDLIVGMHDGAWTVWDDHGETLGRYETAGGLGAGLSEAIAALY